MILSTWRHSKKRIRSEIDKDIKAVLDHGQYIMGSEMSALEKELFRFAGVKHAISCASGTDALLTVLMCRGIGPTDAMLTTPFTFIATAEVIRLLGATPVFVDIDRRTYKIDPQHLEQCLSALQQGDAVSYPLPRPTDQGKITSKAVFDDTAP